VKSFLGIRNNCSHRIKAKIEYTKTRDIPYVIQLLGHRNIKNTVYTQLTKFEKGDEFHSASVKTTEEAKQLVEDGFECLHQKN